MDKKKVICLHTLRQATEEIVDDGIHWNCKKKIFSPDDISAKPQKAFSLTMSNLHHKNVNFRNVFSSPLMQFS